MTTANKSDWNSVSQWISRKCRLDIHQKIWDSHILLHLQLQEKCPLKHNNFAENSEIASVKVIRSLFAVEYDSIRSDLDSIRWFPSFPIISLSCQNSTAKENNRIVTSDWQRVKCCIWKSKEHLFRSYRCKRVLQMKITQLLHQLGSVSSDAFEKAKRTQD